MQTCVVIPRELSLVLRTEPIEVSDREGFKPLPEMGATLWSNSTLAPGKTFLPDDGEVRLEKLEIYSLLKEKDVSCLFHVDFSENYIQYINDISFKRVHSL